MGGEQDDSPSDFGTEEALSVLLHAIRSSRRRWVIQLLEAQSQTPVTTRNLARQIAGRETGTEPGQVSGREYKNVYNALSQTHLPTLDDAEVIVYCPQRQVVVKGPLFDLAALMLKINQPLIEALYGWSRLKSDFEMGHNRS
jgi:hypothetical protein